MHDLQDIKTVIILQININNISYRDMYPNIITKIYYTGFSRIIKWVLLQLYLFVNIYRYSRHNIIKYNNFGADGCLRCLKWIWIHGYRLIILFARVGYKLFMYWVANECRLAHVNTYGCSLGSFMLPLLVSQSIFNCLIQYRVQVESAKWILLQRCLIDE